MKFTQYSKKQDKLHSARNNAFLFSRLFTLRSRINGGGVLLSRGLETCVKYNKRGVGISGGRKNIKRVPFRLV